MKGLPLTVLLTLGLAAGCGTLTSSMGPEDHTISDMVKARLTTMAAGRSAAIGVDTYDRTVYLTGGVETPEIKRRAEETAAHVPNVALVVNNLHVVRAMPAASPRTVPATVVVPRVLAGSERLARLDIESGTPAWTRYAGYDSNGRRVATVFAVMTTELGDDGVHALPVDLPVDHLSVHRDGATAYVVMWHGRHTEEASVR